MELAQELFLTAVVAVLFSFVVAKLVSVALSSKESVDGSKFPESGGDSVSPGPFVEEVRFFEELRSPPVGRETRVVEAVQEELRTVDRFGGEEPLVAEELVVAEKKDCDGEVGLESGMVLDETSEITEKSSGKEVSGEAEILAGEAVECAAGEMEGSDGEASREANRLHDVEVRVPVVEAGEVANVVIEEEKVVDEDDWEGIERSELEKDFAAAARFADDRKDRLEAAMGDDAKMQLYGLHKVATEGPCHDSPPMALKVSARAKWNAWQRLGNMNPDLAMEQYINLLSESIPNWSDGNPEETGESDASTLQQQDSPLGAVSDHPIESVVVRETSKSTIVKLDDPSHEASLVGRAKE